MRRIVFALLAAVLLAACGSSSDAGNTSGSDSGGGNASATTVTTAAAAAGDFNDADVSFAQGMIPHHQQAVEMAKMVPGSTDRAELKEMAQSIVSAQQGEISDMQGWLRAWGKPEAAQGDHSQHNGMSGMGGNGMGMMDEAQMGQLGKANGAAFDAMFLRMMIVHHQGAIEMARTEQAKGNNPDAKHLAGNIISAQQREIAQMKDWQQAWSLPSS